MFKEINRLTWTPLTWVPDPNRERTFVTVKYQKEECFIRLNDFPEEPLWSLFFKGDKLDLEYTPRVWDVLFDETRL
jgi:hypothetical protein